MSIKEDQEQQKDLSLKLPLGELFKLKKSQRLKEKNKEQYFQQLKDSQLKKHREAPTIQNFQTKKQKDELVFDAPKQKHRDPWFDDQYGKLDVSKFTESYGFIKDLQKQEINQVNKILSSKRQLKRIKQDQLEQLKEFKRNTSNQQGQLGNILKKIEIKKQIKKQRKEEGIVNPFVSKKDIQESLQRTKATQKPNKNQEKLDTIKQMRKDNEFQATFQNITKSHKRTHL